MDGIFTMSSGGGPGGPRRCSFCGRRAESVGRLVRARSSYICDRCVRLAGEAIAEAPPEQRLLRIRPARAQVADRDAVELAVEQAFETLFDPVLPVEARCAAIEHGDGLAATMVDLGRRYPPGSVDIMVDSVRLLSGDEAEVHLTVQTGRFGAGGLSHRGHAVRTADGWKVARDTWCGLIALAGVTCPPLDPNVVDPDPDPKVDPDPTG